MNQDYEIGVISDNLAFTHGKFPSYSEEERRAQIVSFLDTWPPGAARTKGRVAIVDDEREFLLREKAIIVVGSDWLGKDPLTHWGITPEQIAANHIEVRFVPYTLGISSTILKNGGTK